MNIIFKQGDKKIYTHKVVEADMPTFETGTVHRVYATFALGRDAEWCTRLFVLEMKEADEEGIGSFLTIQHISPAFIGDEVIFTGIYEVLNGNELTCRFEVTAGDRIIAQGTTGQKILKLDKLQRLLGNS